MRQASNRARRMTGATPQKMSVAAPLIAIAEFDGPNLQRISYLSRPTQFVKRFVSESLKEWRGKRPGFVSIVLHASERLADVLESHEKQARKKLVNCLHQISNVRTPKTEAGFKGRTLWIDVCLKMDYASSCRHALEVSRRFGDSEMGRRSSEISLGSSSPAQIELPDPLVSGGARLVEVNGQTWLVDPIRESQTKELRKDQDSYEAILKRAIDLVDVAREEAALLLQPALDKRSAQMPHDTYEEKKQLAKWINSELRRLGLAIKCPKTGLPAFLVAHPGGRPGIGRFHLEITENGRPRRTVTSITVPLPLLLMPDQAERQACVEAPRHSR